MAIVLSALAGCSSYEPAQHPKPVSVASEDAAAGEIVVNEDSIEIRFVPLFDKERAKSYLGINPAKSKIMPALVKVVNTCNEPVKVDMDGSYLVIDPNERWNTLALSEAIHRGLRSDAEVVGWMIALGMPAWYAAASNSANVNRTLEEDYYAKHFKPTLINAGGVGQGIVFFDVREQDECHVSAAVIRIHKLAGDTRTDIRLPVEQDVLVRR
jgi:hypothetical protein